MVAWVLSVVLMVGLVGFGNHAGAKHNEKKVVFQEAVWYEKPSKDSPCPCTVCGPHKHNCVAKTCAKRDGLKSRHRTASVHSPD